jgi:hypothetical protein
MNPKTPAGKTPFQKFQALAKGLVRVPRAEVDQKAKEERKRKQQDKKAAIKRTSVLILGLLWIL